MLEVRENETALRNCAP